MLPLYLNGCSETFPSLQKNVICQSESDRLIIDHRIIDALLELLACLGVVGESLEHDVEVTGLLAGRNR